MLLNFEAVNRLSQRVYSDTFELDTDDLREIAYTIRYVVKVRSLGVDRSDWQNRQAELLASEAPTTATQAQEFDALRERLGQAETFACDVVRVNLIRGNRKDMILELVNGMSTLATIMPSQLLTELVKRLPIGVAIWIEDPELRQAYLGRNEKAMSIAILDEAKAKAREAKAQAEMEKTLLEAEEKAKSEPEINLDDLSVTIPLPVKGAFKIERKEVEATSTSKPVSRSTSGLKINKSTK